MNYKKALIDYPHTAAYWKKSIYICAFSTETSMLQVLPKGYIVKQKKGSNGTI